MLCDIQPERLYSTHTEWVCVSLVETQPVRTACSPLEPTDSLSKRFVAGGATKRQHVCTKHYSGQKSCLPGASDLSGPFIPNFLAVATNHRALEYLQPAWGRSTSTCPHSLCPRCFVPVEALYFYASSVTLQVVIYEWNNPATILKPTCFLDAFSEPCIGGPYPTRGILPTYSNRSLRSMNELVE